MTTANPLEIETYVLAVLAGTPLEQVAVQAGVDSADLAEAVEVYKAAGRVALRAQDRARDWYQLRIRFIDWNEAEQAAADHLGPELRSAHDAGTITHWWFLRKHPCWRLRCRPGPRGTWADMVETITGVLDTMTTEGTVQQWQESYYEPESLTFGGPRGIEIAHDLFHADSQGALTFLRNVPRERNHAVAARRELSVLLCTTLFRGARQDEYEQADIWHRVVRERPLTTEPSPDRVHGMIPSLRRLVALDTSSTGSLFATDGPLAWASDWSDAFATAGIRLADAARDGALERGLRDTLASHVIFHWNRLGLPATTQAVLARAARTALIAPPVDGTP